MPFALGPKLTLVVTAAPGFGRNAKLHDGGLASSTSYVAVADPLDIANWVVSPGPKPVPPRSTATPVAPVEPVAAVTELFRARGYK